MVIGKHCILFKTEKKYYLCTSKLALYCVHRDVACKQDFMAVVLLSSHPDVSLQLHVWLGTPYSNLQAAEPKDV